MEYTRNIVLILVGLTVSVASSTDLRAQTQEPSDRSLDRWQPGLDLESVAGLNVASTPLPLGYDFWLTVGYAGDLLVVLDRDAGVTGELVGPRLVSNLGGSLTIFDWLQIGANLPLILYQARGDSPSLALGPVGDLAAGGMGDLSITSKFHFLTADQAFVDLAALVSLWLPSHYPRDAYLGEDNVSFSVAAVVSRQILGLMLTGNLGYYWRPSSRFLDAKIGPEIRLGLGASLDLEPLTSLPIDAAVAWNLAARHDVPFKRINETPSEFLFEGTYRGWSPIAVSLGVGFGLVAGIGTPDARVILGVRWAHRPQDTDIDGVPDNADKCPQKKEDRDGFEDDDGCPDPDNDGDGIKDEQDSCPNAPEIKNDFEDEDGCPDKAALLEKGRIALAGEVHFEVGKAVLKRRSRTLLNEIADLLHKHTQIRRVRIEGHTDSDGDAGVNKRLSQARAESVRRYLISRGVESGRLVAEGFGESLPVASNKTARGRAKNRRVDFVIDEIDE